MSDVLTITGIGFPPLSSRKCSQDLNLISQGKFVRTLNGELLYLSSCTQERYQSVIKGEDQESIAISGLNVGMEVDVGCIQPLTKQTTCTEVVLDRPYVEGSVIAFDECQREIPILAIEGQTIRLGEFEGIAFIRYRPILKMKIIKMSLGYNEWKISADWEISLEEI